VSLPMVFRSITDPGHVNWNHTDDAPPWASLPVQATGHLTPSGRVRTAPSVSTDERCSSVGSKEAPSSASEAGRAKTFLERTHSTSLLWAAQLGRTVSGTLNRHGLNLNSSSVVPTQRCNICLESVPMTLCVVPRACGRQAHSACTQCMGMYIKLLIEEGRVADLWCPCAGSDGCDAKVADCEVESWMSQSVVEKYKRFTRMRADSRLRACPQCNELVKPEVQEVVDAKGREARSVIIPEMTCGSCGCQFCYYHSNAHEVGPKACAAHEREILAAERKALAKINTHKCPQCGVLTEKLSGCNHMTCQCKCQWCWVCGQEITNVGWHYHPLRPFSCAQYNEKTAQRDRWRLTALMTCTKVLTWPSAIVAALFLLVCPFAFLTAVLVQVVPLSAVCGCCFFYCICFRDADMEDVVKIILSVALGFTFLTVGIPFLVFCLAWFFVALPLWLILLLPLGARSEHLLILACAPVMTVLASMECFAPEAE